MRSLLALLAIAMFVGTIGCNNATEEPAPAPSTQKTEDGGDKKEAAASDETASAGELQEVSLTLPAMT